MTQGKSLPAKRLPARPNLEHLKKQAKKLLRELSGSDASAKLADAQLALARQYGFASWKKLAAHLESLPPAELDEFIASLPLHRRTHKITQWKPIMDAAFLGDAARVRRLLAGGADPNVVSTTPHRYRPLHRAIEFKKTFRRGPKHEGVVKLLLESGADPKFRASWSRLTALQLAAIGEYRFVPLLLPYFEPLDIFHAAATADEPRVLELLKKEPTLAKAKDANDWTALHYCAASAAFKEGKDATDALVRIATALLKHGADPMAKYLFNDEWSIPVLYHCCGQHDNPAFARVLFEAGAEPYDSETVYHATDEDHRGCLALFEQYTEKTKLAAECTKCLCTQLHWGHSRGAPWLLAHGADPNALHPKFGDSALHAAVKRRSSDKVIELLLGHGADPNRKNAQGKSVVQLARVSKRRLPNRPCPTGRDGPAGSPRKVKSAARMAAALSKNMGGRK